MPTAQEVLKDDNFWGLPVGERRKVLGSVDPNFGGLPESEQLKVISQRSAIPSSTPEPPQDKGFFATLGEDIKGMGKVANAALNPFASPQPLIDAGKGMVKSQLEQFPKALDAAKQGRYSEAAGYTGAGLLPVLGPFAAQIGEEVGNEQYGQAGAHALELAGPSVMEMLPAVRIGGFKSKLNPTEEAATQSVAPNVRMTPGQRAGKTGLVKAERNLTNIPQTADRAENFFQGQQADLAAEGARRVAKTGVPSTDVAGAAETARVELGKLINASKTQADQLYDSVRQATSKAKQTLEIGKDAKGKPVYQDFEAPVNIEPIAQSLKPVYEELLQTFPEGQRQYSPAFQALKQVMDSNTKYMSAMDFDKFLGAVKAITRNGKSPYLNTQSQALANKVVAAGEQEFAKALQGTGPNTTATLQKAREAVKEYHDVADFLEPLDRKESGALYSKLTKGKEQSLETLQYLEKKAPQVNKIVGRTYLEQLMNKATNEGGFSRTAGVYNDWANGIGPRSKELLFGKAVVEDMDKFFLAAKKLNPGEGSPTAGRISAFLHYGDIGTAIAEVTTGAMMGHPAAGVGAAAMHLLKTRVQPEILARISLKPAGAKLLRQSMEVPINSPKFNETMRALEVMGEQEQAAQESPGSRALKKP